MKDTVKDISFFKANREIENFLVNRVNESSISDVSKEELLEEFNEAFAQYSSSLYTIPTTTGTSALHLAVCAIDLKRGDKVFCSVNSSPEIPEIVRHFDAEPIFIDIVPGSFQMNMDKIEELLKKNSSKKIKGIVVSHIGGEVADVGRLKEIVGNRNIKIIEDATQILGLEADETETVSDIKIYNLEDYGVDNLANLGVFTTDNEELYERATLLSNHGLVFEDEELDLKYIYDVKDIGCQYMAGKLGLLYGISKLQIIQSGVERRREIAEAYTDFLQNTPHITVDDFKEAHSYYYFMIRIDKNRDHFARELKKRGIETGLHYIPLHLQSYYKNKYALRVNDYPNALRTFQQVLSIPINDTLSDDDVEYIAKEIRKVAENRV